MTDKPLLLGAIGYGNMAAAIIGAAVDVGETFSTGNIMVADRSPERLTLAKELGLHITTATEIAQRCDIILLAVKPQQFDEVLVDIAPYTAGKCIVSIAAGISSKHIRARLTDGTFVLRVMPNTPILLGCGATVVAKCDDIPQNLHQAALSLFESAGITVTLPEQKINEATGINGSSPAYFFLMAEAMVRAGELQGIDPDDALLLSAKAMQGAAEMLLRSGKTPQQLREMVCSPGGTTLAALDAMQRAGFSEAIVEGMLACTKRAHELGD